MLITPYLFSHCSFFFNWFFHTREHNILEGNPHRFTSKVVTTPYSFLHFNFFHYRARKRFGGSGGICLKVGYLAFVIIRAVESFFFMKKKVSLTHYQCDRDSVDNRVRVLVYLI